jgi:hypothetical protein
VFQILSSKKGIKLKIYGFKALLIQSEAASFDADKGLADFS